MSVPVANGSDRRVAVKILPDDNAAVVVAAGEGELSGIEGQAVHSLRVFQPKE